MIQSDLTAYYVELLTLLPQLLPFACRVVTLHGYLNAVEYARLYGAASYHVNALRCEGLCLSLMGFMSCDTPAVTPDYSAMTDYMDTQVGFVVRSSQELTAWPQDSHRLYSTWCYQPSWESLREVYLKSYRVAREQLERYRQLSTAVSQCMHGYCADSVIRQHLESFLSTRKVTPALGIELTAIATGNVLC